MPGTKEGAKIAAKTNTTRYGKNFYRIIGSMGGKNGTTGGFGSKLVGKDGLTGKERALVAGATGGKISRRGPSKRTTE